MHCCEIQLETETEDNRHTVDKHTILQLYVTVLLMQTTFMYPRL